MIGVESPDCTDEMCISAKVQSVTMLGQEGATCARITIMESILKSQEAHCKESPKKRVASSQARRAVHLFDREVAF